VSSIDNNSDDDAERGYAQGGFYFFPRLNTDHRFQSNKWTVELLMPTKVKSLNVWTST